MSIEKGKPRSNNLCLFTAACCLKWTWNTVLSAVRCGGGVGVLVLWCCVILPVKPVQCNCYNWTQSEWIRVSKYPAQMTPLLCSHTHTRTHPVLSWSHHSSQRKQPGANGCSELSSSGGCSLPGCCSASVSLNAPLSLINILPFSLVFLFFPSCYSSCPLHRASSSISLLLAQS